MDDKKKLSMQKEMKTLFILVLITVMLVTMNTLYCICIESKALTLAHMTDSKHHFNLFETESKHFKTQTKRAVRIPSLQLIDPINQLATVINAIKITWCVLHVLRVLHVAVSVTGSSFTVP